MPIATTDTGKSIPMVMKRITVTGMTAAAKNSIDITGMLAGSVVPGFVFAVARGATVGSVAYDPATVSATNIDLYPTTVTACDLYFG